MSSRNPFQELEQLFRRLSSQVEGTTLGLESVPGMQSTAVDVRDRGDAFVVTVNLPGFDRENVDVTLADTTLRVHADRDLESETGEGEFIRRERRQQSVSRSISLPEPVDEDGVSATFSNGVLTVELPKMQASASSRQLQIE